MKMREGSGSVNPREDAARKHSVPADVHADDLLWNFINEHAHFSDPVDAANYYFSDGAESAMKLATLVAQNLPEVECRTEYSLLEFASGYGMVTRHLRNALPAADVTACDIHPAAHAFIENNLAVRYAPSVHSPDEFSIGRQFDVVFALSFFSHMPRATFGGWLRALMRHVRENGILIFTTHGLESRSAFGDPELSADGFWFKPDSEQHDLSSSEYGSSVSAPEFVIRQLFLETRAPLAAFKSGFWWGHQDLYVAANLAPLPGAMNS